MNYKNVVPAALLTGFLLAGILSYSDYGIAWDETFQYHDNGHAVWNYIANGDFESYEKNIEKYHGPAFELVLVAFEKVSGVSGSRNIFLQRHLLSFLFYWLSGLVLFLLLRNRYQNTILISIGICWYFLMPCIYADSFYNTKDIPFMAMTMICLYSLYKIIQRQSIKWILVHAVFCGFLIGIRIMGVTIPLITILVIAWLIYSGKTELQKGILHSGLFIFLTGITIIVCWPILWLSPIKHFVAAWSEMSAFQWNNLVLYRGEYHQSSLLPWHYSVTWITITTPLMYIVFLLISVSSLFAKPSILHGNHERVFNVILLSLFVVPLFAVWILQSTVYDGWRHLYFLYAPLVLLSVSGLSDAIEYISKKSRPIWLLIPVLLVTGYTGWWMYKWHPYQHIYFNSLVESTRENKINGYELDYWGLSYRESLQKLADNNSDSILVVYVANAPGIMNSWILEDETRDRFRFVLSKDSADYYITNYRWSKKDETEPLLIDSIVVDGIRISGTYKISNN